MGAPFYIGMIAPFILLYIFNWIVFVIITVSFLYKSQRKVSSNNAGHGMKSGMSTRQQFMIAVTLSVLFGIGWGIGLLATEELGSKVAHDIFASLFVIITSFHGLLIFILHCVRSKEAKKEWRRWFFKATRKEFSDFTSSTFGHIQHKLKTTSLQPLSLSSGSKTTEKFDMSAGRFSPVLSMDDNVETLKMNVMKHNDPDCSFNLLSVETKLDTSSTKVDLAGLEAGKINVSLVESEESSTTQALDIGRKKTPKEPELEDDKALQVDFQDAAEKEREQEEEQPAVDEEQSSIPSSDQHQSSPMSLTIDNTKTSH